MQQKVGELKKYEGGQTMFL